MSFNVARNGGTTDFLRVVTMDQLDSPFLGLHLGGGGNEVKTCSQNQEENSMSKASPPGSLLGEDIDLTTVSKHNNRYISIKVSSNKVQLLIDQTLRILRCHLNRVLNLKFQSVKGHIHTTNILKVQTH